MRVDGWRWIGRKKERREGRNEKKWRLFEDESFNKVILRKI